MRNGRYLVRRHVEKYFFTTLKIVPYSFYNKYIKLPFYKVQGCFYETIMANRFYYMYYRKEIHEALVRLKIIF